MNKEDILDLIKIMDDNDLTALRFENGRSKIELERNHGMLSKTNLPAMADRVKELIQDRAESVHAAAIEPQDSDELIVKNPMVGTFYTSPSPDEEPFVKIGSEVLSGQTLGIVEAMKMMNEITAPKAGIITEIYTENEEQIEYDQPLFKISTSA